MVGGGVVVEGTGVVVGGTGVGAGAQPIPTANRASRTRTSESTLEM